MSEEKGVYNVVDGSKPKPKPIEKTYGIEDTLSLLLEHLEKTYMFHAWVATPDKKLTNVLEKNNFQANTTKEDFLQAEPPFENFDILIASTGTTMKDKFVEKCFSYLKPFAILLPLTALTNGKTNELFRQYGITVLVLDKPVNLTGRKGKGVPVAWFVWGVFSGNQLLFETL